KNVVLGRTYPLDGRENLSADGGVLSAEIEQRDGSRSSRGLRSGSLSHGKENSSRLWSCAGVPPATQPHVFILRRGRDTPSAGSGKALGTAVRCRRYENPALQTAHFQLGERRSGLTSLKGLPPVGYDLEQRSDVQSRVLCGIFRQIARRARQQRLAPDQI